MKKENNTDKLSNTLTIPTREEFHRYAQDVLNINDFCTDYPCESYYHVNKIASSIRWTIKNRNFNKYAIRRNSI